MSYEQGAFDRGDNDVKEGFLPLIEEFSTFGSDYRHLHDGYLKKRDKGSTLWSRFIRLVHFMYWRLFLKKSRCQESEKGIMYFPADGSSEYCLGAASARDVFEFEISLLEKNAP